MNSNIQSFSCPEPNIHAVYVNQRDVHLFVHKGIHLNHIQSVFKLLKNFVVHFMSKDHFPVNIIELNCINECIETFLMHTYMYFIYQSTISLFQMNLKRKS